MKRGRAPPARACEGIQRNRREVATFSPINVKTIFTYQGRNIAMTTNILPRIDDVVFDQVSPDQVAALRADLDNLVADGVAVAPILFDRLDWLVAVEAAGFVVDVETGLVIDSPVLPLA